MLVNHRGQRVSIHVLHALLYTFPMVLMRRICLKIRSFLNVIIYLILLTFMLDSRVILLGENRCKSL